MYWPKVDPYICLALFFECLLRLEIIRQIKAASNRDYMSVHFNHIRLINTCNQVLVNDSDRSDTIVHLFEGMYCT